MKPHFLKFLEYLNKHKVKYMVIGAYAVMLYTESHGTKDFDIWIEADEENSIPAYKALTDFGAPLSDLNPTDFSQEHYGYRVGIPPNMIEVITSISALKFDEAWENRKIIEMKEGLSALHFL